MIYNLIIYLYASAVRLAALFNKKASLMVDGHAEAFDKLKREIDSSAKYIWFHAASVGEVNSIKPLVSRFATVFPFSSNLRKQCLRQYLRTNPVFVIGKRVIPLYSSIRS